MTIQWPTKDDIIDLQDHTLTGRFKRRVKNYNNSIKDWMPIITVGGIFLTVGGIILALLELF